MRLRSGSAVRAEQLTPTLGAVLHGVDLSARDAATIDVVREALLLDGLTATHDFTNSRARRRPLDDEYPPVSHPVAVADYTEPRVMHRVVIDGTPPSSSPS